MDSAPTPASAPQATALNNSPHLSQPGELRYVEPREAWRASCGYSYTTQVAHISLFRRPNPGAPAYTESQIATLIASALGALGIEAHRGHLDSMLKCKDLFEDDPLTSPGSLQFRGNYPTKAIHDFRVFLANPCRVNLTPTHGELPLHAEIQVPLPLPRPLAAPSGQTPCP